MANKIEQFSRILQHRVTGTGKVFTNPTSNDHTDETWSETDLYIGELGINVTDDTIFMRTNNGIIQLATATASGGTASLGLWFINGSNELQIGTTFSPVAIVRGSGYFTDLGTSTIRFKDLYLGGSSDGSATMNVNGVFNLRDASESILSTINLGTNRANLIIASASSTSNKIRGLHLNSQTTTVYGFGGERAFLSSGQSVIYDSFRTAVVAGQGVVMGTVSNSLYTGLGQSRDFDYSSALGVGGRIVLRGVEDDGSDYYNRSENIKGQEKLTTSNALTTPIFTHSWDTGCGEVFSGKFWVTAVDVIDPSRVYSAELFVNASYDGVEHMIGNPIIQEANTMDPTVELSATVTPTGLDINVIGESTTTIKWLLTYEYHRIINVC